MFLWHWQTVILQSEDVTFNRFPDIGDCCLPAFALRDAAWKTRALRYPKAIFAGINNHLSHAVRIPCAVKSSIERMRAYTNWLCTKSW